MLSIRSVALTLGIIGGAFNCPFILKSKQPLPQLVDVVLILGVSGYILNRIFLVKLV